MWYANKLNQKITKKLNSQMSVDNAGQKNGGLARTLAQNV